MSRHAVIRLKERYGLDLGGTLDFGSKVLSEAIRQESMLLAKSPFDAKEFRCMVLKGVTIKVVYNPITQNVITVLPPETTVMDWRMGKKYREKCKRSGKSTQKPSFKQRDKKVRRT